MAERRMFSKKITESDAFLEMPASAQCLYFHLNLSADDDGFVNAPRKIMRMIGASEDDMRILIGKRFILTFESGVIVVKHWRIHNYIQKDRYTPTTYIEEKKALGLDENKAYTDSPKGSCIQSVYKLDTQDRKDKESIGKYRKEKGTGKGNRYDSAGNPPLDEERLRDLLDRRKI